MPVFKETKKPAANPEVKETVEAEVKETLAVKDVQKLRCKSRAYMVNPFSKDRFFPEEPIDATVDSWLDSQIKAKLIQPC